MFAPDNTRLEVLLFSITPVTFEPITALMVVAPAPLPALVIVPALFRLVVVALIAPVPLALNVILPVPVTPPDSVKVLVPLLVRVVPLLLTLSAPLIVNADVLLLSITPVTFEPIAALIVVVPVPLPVFVMVPVLFRLVELKVIVPVVPLLITRLLVPVTPPVKVVEIAVPVVPTVKAYVSLLASTIAFAKLRPVVPTNKLAVAVPLLTPKVTLPVPKAFAELNTVNVPVAIVVPPA